MSVGCCPAADSKSQHAVSAQPAALLGFKLTIEGSDALLEHFVQ